LVQRYPSSSRCSPPDLIASVERGQLWTEGLLTSCLLGAVGADPGEQHRVSLFAYCAGFLFGWALFISSVLTA